MITRSTIILVLFCSALFAFGQSEKQKTYALAIKFISYGTGVPDKKPVIDFINVFKKKNKIKKIQMDRLGPMGKEGEYHLVLFLNELTKKQKVLFVREIKKVSKKPGDNGEIQYEENVPVNEPKNRKPPAQQKVIIE